MLNCVKINIIHKFLINSYSGALCNADTSVISLHVRSIHIYVMDIL